MLSSEGSIVDITATLLLPSKEFFKILVSLEVLYGINFYELFYASPDITFPKADRDVLMNLAY